MVEQQPTCQKMQRNAKDACHVAEQCNELTNGCWLPSNKSNRLWRPLSTRPQLNWLLSLCYLNDKITLKIRCVVIWITPSQGKRNPYLLGFYFHWELPFSSLGVLNVWIHELDEIYGSKEFDLIIWVDQLTKFGLIKLWCVLSVH